MFTSNLIDILVALVVILPLITLGQLFLLALSHRRTTSIAIRPTITLPNAEAMHPFLREHLGRLTHALQSIGFRAAASGRTSLGPHVAWTQVLFVHPASHHRCSVLFFLDTHRRTAKLTCGFASETQTGLSVKTDVASATKRPNTSRTPAEINSPETIAAAFEIHLDHVRTLFKDQPPAPIPPPGEELNWLTERAAIITRALAARRNLRPARNGLRYVANRRDAISATWRRAFPFRLFLPQRPRIPAAFEVIPPPAPTAPSTIP